MQRYDFISEEIRPDPGTFDPAGMARGEPGLPRRFTWRGQLFEVTAVLRTWKTSAREGGRASGELYLRRPWFEVQTAGGDVVVLYCLRHVASARGHKHRWFVYSINAGEQGEGRTDGG